MKALKYKWELRGERERLRISITGGKLSKRIYEIPPLPSCKKEWFANGQLINSGIKVTEKAAYKLLETRFKVFDGRLIELFTSLNMMSNNTNSKDEIIRLVKKQFNENDSISGNELNFKILSNKYLISLEDKMSERRSGKVSDSHKVHSKTGLNWANKYFVERPINEIGLNDLNEFVTYLGNKDMQPSTIKARLNTVKRFFNWCKSNKYISQIPEIPKIKLNESKGIAYTIEELGKISKLGDKLEGPNKIVWARFMVQCYCGCRYSDLDTVMDEANIKYDKNGMKYIEYRQQKTFNITNVNWHTDFDFLFQIAKQEKYLNSWMNVRLKEIAKGWEVPLNKKKPTTHDARRTFISCCLLKNIPIGDLMNFSGHSEIKSVQRYNKFIGREAISSIHNPMMSDSQVRAANKEIENSKKKLPLFNLHGNNRYIILGKTNFEIGT